MAIPGIHEIQALATKYSKAQLQKMAQMGMIDPTKAVMAGMMIDRIQKQNMQPPQQTVAEEVMGEGAPTMQTPPPGVAGLPSGMPEQMAGGGIVAFADGGETEDYAGGGAVAFADRGLVPGGITDVVDPGWRDPKTAKRKYSDDDKFAVLAERLAELTTAERSAQGEDKVRIQKDMDELRGEMRKLRPSPSVSGLLGLLPSAQAAERTPVKKAVPETGDYYQDPFGAPSYETENKRGYFSPEIVEPGKPYEPSLRGAIFGYEQGKLPPVSGPKPAEKKPEAAAPTTFEPKVEEPSVAPGAPAEKAEMGPSRPSFSEKLANLSLPVPEPKTLEGAIQEQEKADQAMGVDKELFNKLRQDYVETKGKFKDRAEKAAGHALMMFGAGLLGGRRGQEWQNASRSAQQALSMYMTSMDKITENEDKISQAMRELSLAEDQYKRSRSDKALAKVQHQQDKIDQIKMENNKLEVQGTIKAAEFNLERIKIDNPPQWTLIQNLAKDSGKSPVDIFMVANGVAKTGGMTLAQALEAVQRNPKWIGKDIGEQTAEARRIVGESGGVGASSLAPGQVVDGYKYKGGDPNSQSSWEKVK